MSKSGAQNIGIWGEAQSCAFLKRQGYRIAETNFRTRRGEIDIIAYMASEGRFVLSFIEVKTRSSLFSLPEYATEAKKRQRIYRAAIEYCALRGIDLDSVGIRFEHISLYINRLHRRLHFQKRLLPMVNC
ncbi:MAG: YraN family protein [Candidatus Magasanikbacteria bacterium]|nr:YraN family protein [Candidatus Magasanikbacteria bacterium]